MQYLKLVLNIGINKNSIPALAVICICLYLAARNTTRLEAQTKAATIIPSILDATFYTMEELMFTKNKYYI